MLFPTYKSKVFNKLLYSLQGVNKSKFNDVQYRVDLPKQRRIFPSSAFYSFSSFCK